MQIQSIKISNILSFKYLTSEDPFEGVHFLPSDKGVTNILIGPNWAWKSNFLEIINQILKVGIFKEFEYSPDLVKKSTTPEDKKKALYLAHRHYHFLKKHIHYLDKPSDVWLTMKLSDNDFDNIAFLVKFRQQINDLIDRYSSFGIVFPEVTLENLRRFTVLQLHFYLDEKTQEFVLDRKVSTPELSFLFDYLEYFDLIQECIEIYNLFEKKPDKKFWYKMKNTFGIIGSYRNYSVLDNSLTASLAPNHENLERQLFYENTKTQATRPLWFELAKNKLVCHYDKTTWKTIFLDHEQILHSPLMRLINHFTKEYLGVSFVTHFEEKDQWRTYWFWLADKQGKEFEINDLSSWEKSLLIMIFSIYWFDLQNGLMVIDEPELHLHPQLQKQFVALIDDISQKLNIQFIIATHSPIMVNEQNINNVYRFYRKHNFTHIVSPQQYYLEQESNLVQMLKFTNSSKMFFVDTIIMCEGETDEYFFNFYLNHLASESDDWKARIRNYEIMNVNGKGSYKMWRKFLKKFGLQSFFIGDWDNIREELKDVDFHQVAMSCKKIEGHHYLPYRIYRKTHKYEKMVNCIDWHFPDLSQRITKTIDELHKSWIFFLKKWDIETYLGLEEKWLDEIVAFCQHRFQAWLTDPKHEIHRKNFDDIFSSIFPPLSE